MDYNSPLIEGQFIKRYKRFFADVELDGKIVVAHIANTGSLKGICDKPRPCRLLPNDNPERKLKFSLEQIQTESSWVGVNTHRANSLVWEAYQAQKIPHWLKFSEAKPEFKINAETRLDFKLSTKSENHFVEVKSVTLTDDDSSKKLAIFPDAVTTRGQKHIVELMKLHKEGATCELFFVIQRTDCNSFSPADKIDPEYGRLLREAHKLGIKLSAYQVALSSNQIVLDCKKKIKITL